MCTQLVEQQKVRFYLMINLFIKTLQAWGQDQIPMLPKDKQTKTT
jgi:hypothetical protein